MRKLMNNNYYDNKVKREYKTKLSISFSLDKVYACELVDINDLYSDYFSNQLQRFFCQV